MRILHVSDFHFHQPSFAWTRRVARRFDAVAITGDFLDEMASTPLAAQVAWVKQWMKDFPVRLLVCSGNHDQERDDLPPELQHWLADLDLPQVTTDGGVGNLGSWTVECVGWGETPILGGPDSLALVHCPPSEAKTALEDQAGTDHGDFELAQVLRHGFRPPTLVLSGHVHWRQRFYDRVGLSLSLNPGFAVGLPPNHIIIDLTVRTAEFVGSDEAPAWVSF